MDDIFGCLSALFVIVIVALVGVFIFVSIKIPLGNTGSHTGYVTAVEREGVFYKKYRVYFKTDTSSSQEDEYCVENSQEQLALSLEKRAETKKLTVLKYKENFILGVFNGYCEIEITGYK